jgi:O-succinylbenzoic acid--CoA ligase
VPAVAIGDSRWSADACATVVARIGRQLSGQGLRAGDIVLRATDDPVHLLLMQHALVYAGAGLLPHPADLSAAAVDDLSAAVGAEWRWHAGSLMASGLHRAGDQPNRFAPALLIRTSGSGGAPKAVMLTTAQLLASAERVNAALDLRAGDEWLCVLPLHHIGGLAIGWRCALAGATLRLLRDAVQGGFNAQALAAALARHPITHLSLVPAMLARLLEVMPTPPQGLRVLLLGGQALHPALARRASAAGWPLYLSYGMSETSSMIAVGAWQDDVASGCRVGPPLPDVTLDCAEPHAPPRALRLRGPMLMSGYADASRRPGVGLADGWLTTSDLCRLDADGALRIFGRADDLVVIGGEQVSPAAVEAKLAAAPGVQEVAVVTLDHPHWGATLAACWRGPAAPAAVEAWCRSALSVRERPRIFRRVNALPLLASGKPDRAALVRLAATPDTPGCLQMREGFDAS